MSKDYYSILGINKSATQDEIKKAFRKKAHQFHPDKAGGDDADSELSQREQEVLQLAAKGLSNQAIADKLHLSIRTVQRNLNSIFNKLSVGSRTEAIFQSVKRGWLSFEDIV